MIETADGLRLSLEPLLYFLAGGHVRREHFYGDSAVKPCVFCLIDFADAPRTGERFNLIRS